MRDLSGGVVAARMFALLMGITGVVPVLAPLIGGQVLLVTSWRGVFVVLAALAAPLLLATATILPETLPVEDRHTGGLRTIVGICHLSPQLFSLVFAVNSAGLIAMSLVSGRLVGRVGPVTLLRRGLFGTFVASL